MGMTGGPNGVNRTRHTGLYAPVACGGIGTMALRAVHTLECKSSVAALDYTSVQVKRQGLVLRIIWSLMGGP